MKFIRELIEQKSNDAEAAAYAAEEEHVPPAEAEPIDDLASTPFDASELYRIMDEEDEVFEDDLTEVEPEEVASIEDEDTGPADNRWQGVDTAEMAEFDDGELGLDDEPDVDEEYADDAAFAESVTEWESFDTTDMSSEEPEDPMLHVARIVSSNPTSAPEPETAIEPAAPVDVQVSGMGAMGRGKGRAGRAKTRLLGFNSGLGSENDPFAAANDGEGEAAYTTFPVGWLVVVDGPGRGAAFTLFNGVAQIGRGEGQTVRLDFGDNSISRENHAAIAFDAEQNGFYIGHGGKANLVRCNNMPVLSTQALSPGDNIRIGETTLRFVPLCGPDFQWADEQKGQSAHVAHG